MLKPDTKKQAIMAHIKDNKGNSPRNAVVIRGAANTTTGLLMEHQYLKERFGKKGIEWKKGVQMLEKIGDKWYDKIEIILLPGTRMIVYFDITEFYGK
ncbi:MAG: hypothetical protein ABIH89_10095 [Elusimicrobiota bacterium]